VRRRGYPRRTLIFSVTVTDNREREIADAIRSVLWHVDRVLLVDTGVTDHTVQRAREVAGDKLVVVKHVWRDFSAARNEGLDAAKGLGAQWTLIVDSDERINFGTVNLRRELARTKADVLLVESDDGLYPKQRIVRAGSSARFHGPTHEALLGGKQELLRGVTFSELPKTDEQFKKKCVRDVALLVPFIAEHPDDGRWPLYLGEALEGLGQREQAAEAFGECVRLRKTGHEAAWAAFKQAEQLFFLERFDESIAAAARGLGANSTFAECAWIAAESALKLGWRDQAVAWARMAEATGRYKGDPVERLFFRHLPALYELPYDVLRRVDGSHEADFHAAKLARVRVNIAEHDLDKISVSRKVPASNREEARSMLCPPTLAKVCPSARAVRIQFEPPGGRLPMNPSICQHRGELWCVVRAVNYTIQNGEYTIHDPYSVVRTENYLGRLKPSGEFIKPRLMQDLDDNAIRYPSQIVGYEDVRLVSIGDKLTGSATVCDRDPEGRRLIARLHFSAKGDVKRADVQPTNQIHEKNWMPLVVDGDLAWIYSLDPTAILPGPLRACPFALEHLRGGAAIAYGKGYLCVMHEVIDSDTGRVYLHRFVKLDKRFVVTAVSPSWVFAHHGIEFAAGLARGSGKQILISYGIEDHEAWVVRVDAKEIEAMKWMTP
jgi:tetratricopeptide (TPR) repeat protein